jgi:hypothetical protein
MSEKQWDGRPQAYNLLRESVALLWDMGVSRGADQFFTSAPHLALLPCRSSLRSLATSPYRTIVVPRAPNAQAVEHS